MFGKLKKTTKTKIRNLPLNKTIDNKKRESQIKKVLESKKLPIVTLDPLWYHVKENIRTKKMDAKEKDLNNLLKEQGKLNTDLKEYGLVKKNLMQEILTISQELNEKGDLSRVGSLEKLHQSITKTNEKIEEIENKIEEVEENITETNRNLVEETMIIGYEYMEAYKMKKNELDSEIDELRTSLLEKTKERKDWDNQYAKLYNYLHNVIGYENINDMDKEDGTSQSKEVNTEEE